MQEKPKLCSGKNYHPASVSFAIMVDLLRGPKLVMCFPQVAQETPTSTPFRVGRIGVCYLISLSLLLIVAKSKQKFEILASLGGKIL